MIHRQHTYISHHVVCHFLSNDMHDYLTCLWLAASWMIDYLVTSHKSYKTK